MESVVVAESSSSMAKEAAGDADKTEPQKNRIQISHTKKPLFVYLNLAKKYIKLYNAVELSALGMAIPTVITIAEILKSDGLAIQKKLVTSTVGPRDDAKGRKNQKAKIEIFLGKNENLLITAATPAASSSSSATDNNSGIV